MPQVTLDTIVRVHENTAVRELAGEAVLLQFDDGMYYGLDAVGTRLWELIVEHGALRAAHAAALAEFDVAPDVLERDLVTLVAALSEKHLVTLD